MQRAIHQSTREAPLFLFQQIIRRFSISCFLLPISVFASRLYILARSTDKGFSFRRSTQTMFPLLLGARFAACCFPLSRSNANFILAVTFRKGLTNAQSTATSHDARLYAKYRSDGHANGDTDRVCRHCELLIFLYYGLMYTFQVPRINLSFTKLLVTSSESEQLLREFDYEILCTYLAVNTLQFIFEGFTIVKF